MKFCVFILCLGFLFIGVKCGTECVDHDKDACLCLTLSSLETECHGMTTASKLKEYFAGKGTTSYNTITLINSNELTSLPSDVFGSVKYQNLVVGNTAVSSVDDATFQGAKNELETIIFNNNKFTTYNFKSLKNLNKLSGFRVTNDGLTQLPSDAFPSLPYLAYIDLANNSISSLSKGTFENLKKVRNINLKNNKLTTIGEEVFKLPNALDRVTINLNANQITTFHEHAFKDLKLRELDLDDNKLVTLKKDVFEPILDYLTGLGTEPGHIHTKGNPFKCDSTILWLVKKSNSYKSKISNFKCKESGKRLNQLTEADLSE